MLSYIDTHTYFFFKISLEIFFSIEKWSLSMIECITICAGKQYDFHGNCDYMMAKGAASEPNEKFHVTVQVISIYSLRFRKRWQIFSAKIFFCIFLSWFIFFWFFIRDVNRAFLAGAAELRVQNPSRYVLVQPGLVKKVSRWPATRKSLWANFLNGWW